MICGVDFRLRRRSFDFFEGRFLSRWIVWWVLRYDYAIFFSDFPSHFHDVFSDIFPSFQFQDYFLIFHAFDLCQRFADIFFFFFASFRNISFSLMLMLSITLFRFRCRFSLMPDEASSMSFSSMGPPIIFGRWWFFRCQRWRRCFDAARCGFDYRFRDVLFHFSVSIFSFRFLHFFIIADFDAAGAGRLMWPPLLDEGPRLLEHFSLRCWCQLWCFISFFWLFLRRCWCHACRGMPFLHFFVFLCRMLLSTLFSLPPGWFLSIDEAFDFARWCRFFAGFFSIFSISIIFDFIFFRLMYWCVAKYFISSLLSITSMPASSWGLCWLMARCRRIIFISGAFDDFW